MSDGVKDYLREEMGKRAEFTNAWRAGLAAIIGGESAFIPKWEASWRHTDNSRIREFFARRVYNLSDDQLDSLKSDDRLFFNFVYGLQFNHIHHLGQRDAGDGYAFRGGGLIQLTGRANYTRYGGLAGVDLVDNPSQIVDDPRVSCAVAVTYFADRFHGGDFDAMKAAVGVSMGGPDDVKDQLFAKYCQTGEWNAGVAPPAPVANRVLRLAKPPMSGNDVKDLQMKLAQAGCKVGRLDGIFGITVDSAVRQYQMKMGLTCDGVVGPQTWRRLADSS